MLTVLLVQSQTDFLLDDQPYFKLSKAVHEVNKIQRWAAAKAFGGPGHQPHSFVPRS